MSPSPIPTRSSGIYFRTLSSLNGCENGFEAGASTEDQIAISSISLIEMVYLIEKGRISSESMTRTVAVFEDPTALFVEIPVERQIARALARVDVTQIPDMPDRIVAATAVHLNVPIISRDGRIQLSTLRTIW
ncbi:MAG: PIN domain-containing protein [Chloroflexi bacterium]|uniref:type II toxin-antitoxin system VapC family toxin n=1 Tax=Candidatus Flexifilum breve TaxID=3140694 RepID=UPI0031355D4B|nr:PIN domain-containing protein [Chloroflexota bacterium]